MTVPYKSQKPPLTQLEHPLKAVSKKSDYSWTAIYFSPRNLFIAESNPDASKSISSEQKNIIMFEDKNKKACPSHFLLCHK